MAVNLFYSYSHKDEELRDKLETHLSLLKRQGLVHSWQSAEFGKLQGAPKDAKPVTKWDDQDEAFLDVARAIRRAVNAPNPT